MFLKGGALLAAPIAAASVPALTLAQEPAAAETNARLQRLEDEAAIREVHRSWLRNINAGQGLALIGGSVTRVSAHHAGGADRIEIAADGRSATGQFDCAVELEMALPVDSTLAQMAHAQGAGMVRTAERRMLEVEYRKIAGAWTVQSVRERSTTRHATR